MDISGLTKKEKKDIMKGPHIVWDVLSFAVPLLTAYIILTFVIMVSVIQSGSMQPTLDVGNTVFYNRLAYVNHEPSRGDVIVFYSDEYSSYFGKELLECRVIRSDARMDMLLLMTSSVTRRHIFLLRLKRIAQKNLKYLKAAISFLGTTEKTQMIQDTGNSHM